MSTQSTTLRSAASSDSGTFTRTPKLENAFYTDSSLKRIVSLYLSQSVIAEIETDISRFGAEVLNKKVLDWVTDAEKHPPYLRGSGRDSFGRRTNELITSEGWRNLQTMGLREGIVAIGYEDQYAEYSRLVQFIKYHLWAPSSAFVACPSAMQDGAASLLKRHLTSSTSPSTSPSTHQVFQSAFQNLTSRGENAWTSGQWMTERVGGSDVSGTETLATYSPLNDDATSTKASDGQPLGPWVIDGFKWFSSATDSQMTVLLAQTPRGLSAFFAPMRRVLPSGETELNGVTIQRLKNKLGTKAVPTAELELKGLRAHLIGEEGNGVREISAVLNITRVHNSVTAVGLLGRGLAIAKAFAEVRELVGKGNKRLLRDVPLHCHTLAQITLEYRACMLFTYFGIYLLGFSEHGISDSAVNSSASRLCPPIADVVTILRMLTPVMKALTAKTSIRGLQECVEALGGIGYLENEESQHINVTRLYRDANVLSIWEGTTNVLGTDFAKILKGKAGARSLDALEVWVVKALGDTTIGATGPGVKKSDLITALKAFRTEVESTSLDELAFRSRGLMQRLFAVVTGVLMVFDAERDEDGVSIEILKRFARQHGFGGTDTSNWTDEAAWDERIVFGDKVQSGGTTKPRL